VSTIQPDRRLPRRLLSLYVGLVLFGLSMALMIVSRLGLGPWDVLHQGLAERTGLRYGWVVIATGGVVLLGWVPLRQRPGLGTISNVVVIGLSVDAALALLPRPEPLSMRVVFMTTGIVANGVATGLYIGAGLGPGPRDGLMTGLAERGHSIRLVRTLIELSVLGAGWMFGGTVGVGTVLYAVSIGPLAHYFIPRLTIAARDGADAKAGGNTRAPAGSLASHGRDSIDPPARSLMTALEHRAVRKKPENSDDHDERCCQAWGSA
jgi:uncharacterized membrane protein YczE